MQESRSISSNYQYDWLEGCLEIEDGIELKKSDKCYFLFSAIGKIGLITEQIIDSLLWAVRYEESPGVRAEACHTLKILKVKTEEVAEVIQDRFLVESNPLVRE